jgi:hypothetical protein
MKEVCVMTTLTQRADYVNTQPHTISRIRAHASHTGKNSFGVLQIRARVATRAAIRTARIINDRTMLLFDPAVVVRVADSTRLPEWAVTSGGGVNLRAIASRTLRSGAVLLERETLDVVRGVELYTLAEWLDEWPGEGSVL